MEYNDFKILEKYFDEMMVMVSNQAVSNMSLVMRDEVLGVLKRNGRGENLCTKCPSTLLRIAAEACNLYINNRDNFSNDAETKVQKVKRGRTRKSV